MFEFLNLEDIEWKNAPRGYYLTDVKQHTLWHDPNTGATLALMKFPKGVADEIHTHEGTQITIGLSGELLMPPDNVKTKIKPNMVITAKSGVKHGATEFTEESIILFFWDASTKPVV
jgi:quercetin dioxygenase-like cupin family protein